MTIRALRIDAADNVATLLEDGHGGESVLVGGLSVTLREDVAQGHKVALAPVAAGEALIKYGAPIGLARHAIAAGEHVHSENLATALSGRLDYRYAPTPTVAPVAAATTFMGYRRADGRVGTRN
ncbi:MAG TPA: SAF domain-containing protein, partial [Sphingomonas sp.]|nr:SAF domain-containing protein [Sphingomonas sp.]